MDVTLMGNFEYKLIEKEYDIERYERRHSSYLVGKASLLDDRESFDKVLSIHNVNVETSAWITGALVFKRFIIILSPKEPAKKRFALRWEN